MQEFLKLSEHTKEVIEGLVGARVPAHRIMINYRKCGL